MDWARYTALMAAQAVLERKNHSGSSNLAAITAGHLTAYFFGQSSSSNVYEVKTVMSKFQGHLSANTSDKFLLMKAWLDGGADAPADRAVWGDVKPTRAQLNAWMTQTAMAAESEKSREKKKSHKKKT